MLRRPLVIVPAILIVIVAVVAVVKRDTIAGLILRAGDTTLEDEAGRSSPEAKVAIDFLVALRTMDMAAIGRLATPEQVSRLEQEAVQPTPEFQEILTLMLEDLPADPAALRSRIKSVQTHGDRGVVLAETDANSWFVQLQRVEGIWKVAGF
jgi:hypothetical protein